LQLTAFGARDRAFFEVSLCGAPRRQLKRESLNEALRAGDSSPLFVGFSSCHLSALV